MHPSEYSGLISDVVADVALLGAMADRLRRYNAAEIEDVVRVGLRMVRAAERLAAERRVALRSTR